MQTTRQLVINDVDINDLIQIIRTTVQEELKAVIDKVTAMETPARTPEKWVRAKEIANKYSVTESTVWNWARAGKIPAPIKLSSKRSSVFNLQDVENALHIPNPSLTLFFQKP